MPTARWPLFLHEQLCRRDCDPSQVGLAIACSFAPRRRLRATLPGPGAHEHDRPGDLYNTMLIERLLSVIRADPEASGSGSFPTLAATVDHLAGATMGGMVWAPASRAPNRSESPRSGTRCRHGGDCPRNMPRLSIWVARCR